MPDADIGGCCSELPLRARSGRQEKMKIWPMLVDMLGYTSRRRREAHPETYIEEFSVGIRRRFARTDDCLRMLRSARRRQIECGPIANTVTQVRFRG